jgi:diguanylate cyclase (GGDEF)-like protein
MPLVALIDNRTLLVCLWLTASLFALAFARTWKTHRGLRGAGSFALAFSSVALSCLLFAVVPASTPFLRFLNTVVGDSLVCCVFAFLINGIERFFAVRHFARSAWVLVGAASLLVFYFTNYSDSMVARIIVLGSVGCIIRLFIAIELLRHSRRTPLRSLAVLMIAYACMSLWQALGTPLRGTPADYMRPDLIQTSVLFLNLVFIIATGLLLFLLLNDELVIRLEDEAARDFMSGALNRRGVERALLAEMERSRRHGAPLSVALVDLDFFKQINDTRGHAAGDAAIRSVAQAITRSLRAYDHVGRFGGDEFLVLLPDTTSSHAGTVLKRIAEDVARSFDNSLTLSIGLTSMAQRREDGATLLARVDQALYAAKTDGRNCIRIRLLEELSLGPRVIADLQPKPGRRRLSRILFPRRTKKTA